MLTIKRCMFADLIPSVKQCKRFALPSPANVTVVQIWISSGNHHLDVEQVKHGVNKEWIAHWQAVDRAKEVAERARKLEQKYDRDELRERLQPLKHDYLKTDKLGRLALEVVILDILRS